MSASTATTVGYALDLLLAGVERAAILEQISAMEQAGKSLDEISTAIQTMRNSALASAPIPPEPLP